MEVARCEHLVYLVPLFFPLCHLFKIRPCSPASFFGFQSSESPKVNWGEERDPQGVGLLLAPGVLWGLERFNSYSVLLWKREDGCAQFFLLGSFSNILMDGTAVGGQCCWLCRKNKWENQPKGMYMSWDGDGGRRTGFCLALALLLRTRRAKLYWGWFPLSVKWG